MDEVGCGCGWVRRCWRKQAIGCQCPRAWSGRRNPFRDGRQYCDFAEGTAGSEDEGQDADRRPTGVIACRIAVRDWATSGVKAGAVVVTKRAVVGLPARHRPLVIAAVRRGRRPFLPASSNAVRRRISLQRLHLTPWRRRCACLLRLRDPADWAFETDSPARKPLAVESALARRGRLATTIPDPPAGR